MESVRPPHPHPTAVSWLAMALVVVGVVRTVRAFARLPAPRAADHPVQAADSARNVHRHRRGDG